MSKRRIRKLSEEFEKLYRRLPVRTSFLGRAERAGYVRFLPSEVRKLRKLERTARQSPTPRNGGDRSSSDARRKRWFHLIGNAPSLGITPIKEIR